MKYFLLLSSLIVLACNNNTSQKVDTPTTGEITVACDESLMPVIDAEHAVFENQYPHAKVNMIYTSEQEAINLMLQDSARMAIVTRSLYPNEIEILKSQKISKPRYIHLANDGIAFILNPANIDTSFTVDQLKSILLGSTQSWKQLNTKNTLGNIQVVFDNPSSGAIRYLKDSLLNGKELGKNCFAVSNNSAVIDYIKLNKNAIGIIGVSWISDDDDSQVQQFLKDVKVAEVKPLIIKLNSVSNKPMQGNIAVKQYPFWREVTVVSREARSGLGTGFASFMAGDSGQRIFLKAGLVPTKAPVRIIQLN